MQVPIVSTVFNYNNSTIKIQGNRTHTQLLKNRNERLAKGFYYPSKISFGEFFEPNRTVPHIDYEEYCAMSDNTKKYYRKKYVKFNSDKSINKVELVDQRYKTMPLRTENEMDNFMKISSIYNKYKGHPIICLGRSPKWFLNASLWMKDGIDDYKFVAFSKYWYRPDYRLGVKRSELYSEDIY